MPMYTLWELGKDLWRWLRFVKYERHFHGYWLTLGNCWRVQILDLWSSDSLQRPQSQPGWNSNNRTKLSGVGRYISQHSAWPWHHEDGKTSVCSFLKRFAILCPTSASVYLMEWIFVKYKERKERFMVRVYWKHRACDGTRLCERQRAGWFGGDFEEVLMAWK